MKRPGPILFIGLFFVAGSILLAATLSATGMYTRDNGRITYGLDDQLPAPRYYTGIDFDTLSSNDHITVIPLKRYRQQVTNYSCGAVAAMTVMSYYGKPVSNTDAEEIRLAHDMNQNVSKKPGLTLNR